MPRRYLTIPALAMVAVLAATGCRGGGGDDDGGADEATLPDPEVLLEQAADEMAQVETVRLVLEADTNLADLPVRQADAVVTRSGDAQGTAEIEQFGQLVEIQFVLVEDAFHYQLIGNWLEIPREDAAELYDPSAILDPDRGLANLLRNATDPEMQGTDTVSGIETYQVTATFSAADLAALLPGAPDNVDGTLWIGVDRPLLHRAVFDLPGGSVTATLSDFDEPVTITAP